MLYNDFKDILKDIISFLNNIKNYKINKNLFTYGGIKVIFHGGAYKIIPFDKNGHSINEKIYYSSLDKNDYLERAIIRDKKIITIKNFKEWKFFDKFKQYTKYGFDKL